MDCHEGRCNEGILPTPVATIRWGLILKQINYNTRLKLVTNILLLIINMNDE